MEFRVGTKPGDAAHSLQVSLIDALPFTAGAGAGWPISDLDQGIPGSGRVLPYNPQALLIAPTT